MARKKRIEEHENHERWLVSYADFITLLFAFFVVMYSISSVNEGKYRVLSDSIVAAFRDPARSLQPIQIGDLMRSPLQSNERFDQEVPIIQLFKVPVPDNPVQEIDNGYVLKVVLKQG
jgi:chemotaxis protein MotB